MTIHTLNTPRNRKILQKLDKLSSGIIKTMTCSRNINTAPTQPTAQPTANTQNTQINRKILQKLGRLSSSIIKTMICRRNINTAPTAQQPSSSLDAGTSSQAGNGVENKNQDNITGKGTLEKPYSVQTTNHVLDVACLSFHAKFKSAIDSKLKMGQKGYFKLKNMDPDHSAEVYKTNIGYKMIIVDNEELADSGMYFNKFGDCVNDDTVKQQIDKEIQQINRPIMGNLGINREVAPLNGLGSYLGLFNRNIDVSEIEDVSIIQLKSGYVHVKKSDNITTLKYKKYKILGNDSTVTSKYNYVHVKKPDNTTTLLYTSPDNDSTLTYKYNSDGSPLFFDSKRRPIPQEKLAQRKDGVTSNFASQAIKTYNNIDYKKSAVLSVGDPTDPTFEQGSGLANPSIPKNNKFFWDNTGNSISTKPDNWGSTFNPEETQIKGFEKGKGRKRELIMDGHGGVNHFTKISHENLARQLKKSGIEEVGAIKFHACHVGRRDYLEEFGKALKAQGIDFGYLKAATTQILCNTGRNNTDMTDKTPSHINNVVVAGNLPIQFKNSSYIRPEISGV